MSDLNYIKEELQTWENFQNHFEEIKVLNDLVVNSQDEELYKELKGKYSKFKKELIDLELKTWFSNETDINDALLSIHPGAGGIESQDWAEMLLRLYIRYAERHKFTVDINEISSGEEAGIKSATITVHGRYASGYLKAEKGVHRLIRISPFDFNKRRHTSFASVDVIPLIDEKIEIEIDSNDLKIETYRATGAGGQHVNVTDSAVRITHIPTSIVVQCQNERSQFSNKETALKILRARLYEREEEKKKKKLAAIRGEKKKIAWGSQIRTYTLHPYNLIKDHRTGMENSDVDSILDGGIDEFIIAYHQMMATEKVEE